MADGNFIAPSDTQQDNTILSNDLHKIVNKDAKSKALDVFLRAFPGLDLSDLPVSTAQQNKGTGISDADLLTIQQIIKYAPKSSLGGVGDTTPETSLRQIANEIRKVRSEPETGNKLKLPVSIPQYKPGYMIPLPQIARHKRFTRNNLGGLI